jgi:hypothetical protein
MHDCFPFSFHTSFLFSFLFPLLLLSQSFPFSFPVSFPISFCFLSSCRLYQWIFESVSHSPLRSLFLLLIYYLCPSSNPLSPCYLLIPSVKQFSYSKLLNFPSSYRFMLSFSLFTPPFFLPSLLLCPQPQMPLTTESYKKNKKSQK